MDNEEAISFAEIVVIGCLIISLIIGDKAFLNIACFIGMIILTLFLISKLGLFICDKLIKIVKIKIQEEEIRSRIDGDYLKSILKNRKFIIENIETAINNWCYLPEKQYDFYVAILNNDKFKYKVMDFDHILEEPKIKVLLNMREYFEFTNLLENGYLTKAIKKFNAIIDDKDNVLYRKQFNFNKI